jgi:hypothetical protein
MDIFADDYHDTPPVSFALYFWFRLSFDTKAPTGQISASSILSLHSDCPTGSSLKVVTHR